MSEAKVTNIKKVQLNKDKVDNVSISVTLPDYLYRKVMLDSLLSDIPVSAMVEGWIDKFVSTQNISLNLQSFMDAAKVREKPLPGIVNKTLSIAVSRKHYNLARMEAMRQNSTIRALVKGWITDHTREWYVEPVDQAEELDRKAV